MATEKQIEANRRNAQSSTGPRTAEGKERSRVNAVIHGMRTQAFEVLPNEDPAEFRARLDAWFDQYEPRNIAEAQLVRQAAVLCWKLDRAERYEAALMSQRVNEAVAGASNNRKSRLDQALRKLLPNAYEYQKTGPDNANLGLLRAEVESTLEGCRQLIAVWTPMLRQAQAGKCWTPPQEFHAIRLLLKGPEPKIVDPEILDFAVANRMLMHPEIPMIPQNWNDGLGSSFSRHAVMLACSRRPENPAQAREILIAVASREIARLEILSQSLSRESRQSGELAEQAGMMALFDQSSEGERLRRYQFATQRALTKTLETLAKLRLQEVKLTRELEKLGLSRANEPNPVPIPPVLTDPPLETPPDEPAEPAAGANEPNSGPESGASTIEMSPNRANEPNSGAEKTREADTDDRPPTGIAAVA